MFRFAASYLPEWASDPVFDLSGEDRKWVSEMDARDNLNDFKFEGPRVSRVWYSDSRRLKIDYTSLYFLLTATLQHQLLKLFALMKTLVGSFCMKLQWKDFVKFSCWGYRLDSRLGTQLAWRPCFLQHPTKRRIALVYKMILTYFCHGLCLDPELFQSHGLLASPLGARQRRVSTFSDLLFIGKYWQDERTSKKAAYVSNQDLSRLKSKCRLFSIVKHISWTSWVHNMTRYQVP